MGRPDGALASLYTYAPPDVNHPRRGPQNGSTTASTTIAAISAAGTSFQIR